MFSFCNTSLILTSAARVAEEVGYEHEDGPDQDPGEDGLASGMRFPWLVMIASVPALSLGARKHALEQNHPVTPHTVLLQPAAGVLPYQNPQRAGSDKLTHLRCNSPLIYFQNFQIRGPPAMNPARHCQTASWCFAALPAELSCCCKWMQARRKLPCTKCGLKASAHEVSEVLIQTSDCSLNYKLKLHHDAKPSPSNLAIFVILCPPD